MADLVAQRRAILRKYHGGGVGARVVTRTIAGRQVAVSLETGTVVGTAGLTPSQFESQQREFQRTGKIVPPTAERARVEVQRLDTKIRETARTEIQRQKERGLEPVETTTVKLAKKITKKEDVPTKVFGGVAVRAAPVPVTIAERLREKQLTVREEIRRSDNILKRQFSGIVTLGLLGIGRGVIGVVETVRSPIQAAKGAFQALRPKNFQQTATFLANEFLVDPVGTIAEFYSYSKALNFASKTVKRSPVGRFVQEEVFIRTQPKEIRPAVRKIVKASKVQERLNPTRLRDLRRVDFMEVKSLTRTEARAIGKTLRQTDSVVFGSTAARTTAGRLGKRLPVPKDVDIATRSVSDFSSKFINNLPSNLRRNYVIRGQKVIRKINRQPLFDIKPLNRLIPDRSILTRRGWLPVSGYVTRIVREKGSVLPKIKRKITAKGLEIPTRKIIKIEEIRVTGFAEQTIRKGLGTLQVLIEKNIRRAKDPQAFLISLEIQVIALRRAKPKTAIGRLRNKRRIRILSDTIRLLKSKAFARLLERKIPGITKNFPLVAKINTKRLKKINLKQVSESVRKGVARLIKKKKIPPKRPPTKLPPKRLPPSEIPISSILKKPSKAPSIIPRVIPISRIPTKIPRRPTRVPTKLPPSKVPLSKLFKEPSKLPIVPSVIPISRIPRRPPTRLPPSKLPKRPISKLPKVIRKRIIAEKKLIIKEKKKQKQLIKLAEKVIPQAKFLYIPDLYSRVYGIKAKPGEKAAFLRAGRVFTGIEARPLIPARLIRKR